MRINPHEVHISDPEFLEHIYAIRGRNDPTAAGGFQVKGSGTSPRGYSVIMITECSSLLRLSLNECPVQPK